MAGRSPRATGGPHALSVRGPRQIEFAVVLDGVVAIDATGIGRGWSVDGTPRWERQLTGAIAWAQIEPAEPGRAWVAAGDAVLRIDAATGEEVARTPVRDGPVRGFAWASGVVVSGGRYSGVRWLERDGGVAREVAGGAGSTSYAMARAADGAVTWASGGRELRLVEADGRVRWGVTTEQPANSVAFDATGRTVAVGGGGGTITLLDGARGAGPAPWAGPRGEVTELAFRGDHLASGSLDGTVRIWQAGRELARIAAGGAVQAVAWAGDTLWWTGTDGVIRGVPTADLGADGAEVLADTRRRWGVWLAEEGVEVEEVGGS
jgi:hypothetical protein